MPGEQSLVNQLHTGRNTVRMALDLLEAEGVLLPQGHGRRRKIAPIETRVTESFRVTIFYTVPEIDRIRMFMKSCIS